jgi:hypothetical protein
MLHFGLERSLGFALARILETLTLDARHQCTQGGSDLINVCVETIFALDGF